MTPPLIFRAAMPEDAEEMQAIHLVCFKDTTLSKRCFPPDDPEGEAGHLEWIRGQLKQATVACDENNKILGWARWLRRPRQVPPPPRPVLTPDMYPSKGDPEFAAKYFQSNVDHSERIAESEDAYFLAVLVVRPEMQRQGIGSALMRPWIEKADEDEWCCFLNASEYGKGLYEKFGFRTIDVSQFGDGIETHHMKRDARTVKK